MKYRTEYILGTLAQDGAPCPFPIYEIGKRCAWFGGYQDARREGFR